MKKCPICLDNDATKTNVHMIPWFLIKKVVTQDGSGLREMVMSFSLSPRSMSKVYTGQGILPEKIADLGELSELQIEKHEPYSRDYLICPKCEDKLSKLEAFFASEFNDKKMHLAVAVKKSKYYDNTLLTANKYNPAFFIPNLFLNFLTLFAVYFIPLIPIMGPGTCNISFTLRFIPLIIPC